MGFKRILAFVLILCGFCTMLVLGKWQLDRLEWKTQIIAELDQQNDQDPVTTPLILNVDAMAPFQRGRLDGQFLYTIPPIFVGPRTHDEASGYHVLQPFQTNNGVTIMVNRGWIPADMRAGTITLPQTNGFIGGYLKDSTAGAMAAQNRPDIGLWYWADIAAINDLYNLNAVDMVFYQEVGRSEDYPILFDGLPYPRNNHLQYAVFWFAMAGLLLVLTVILWRTSRR